MRIPGGEQKPAGRISHVADNYIADLVAGAQLSTGDCTHTTGKPDDCTVCFCRRELKRLGFWEVATPLPRRWHTGGSHPRVPWVGTSENGHALEGGDPPRYEPLVKSPMPPRGPRG